MFRESSFVANRRRPHRCVAELTSQVLKGPFSAWSHEPRAARLLAGLSLDRAEAGAVHKYDDAFALDRQWWVDLKRRAIYPGEKYDPRPFVCPRAIESPAPVVRAGTEEEANRPGYEQLRDGLVGPTTFSLIGGAPHASNVTHPGAVNAEIVNLLHRLAG